MKKVLKYILYFFIAWFILHTIVIVVDGLTDEKKKADVGVIFGNTVNVDGSLSDRLKARLDKGIKLYKDSLITQIVVSGGLGKEGHYEGTVMYQYLVAKGIPAGKILTDNTGITTEATAEYGRRTLDSSLSVVVISQYHHISRAKLAFHKKGFKEVYGAHADYFELRDFYSILREFFGYYKYLLIKDESKVLD